MLDQSFSAENFKNIFHFENRKGNIKRKMFPNKYIELILEIKYLKKEISEKKKELKEQLITKEAYLQIKEDNNSRIKEIQEKKDAEIYQFTKEISEKVNSDSFKFNLNISERKGKPVYQLDDNNESFYAIKQLQYNIRKTFKVKQANRYYILKQLKLLLADDFPKYILRTDINQFYESIPQEELIKKIEENTLLNFQSKKFINSIISEYEICKEKNTANQGKGIPRGVGICAYLAELYMRDVDSKIKALPDVTFFARYVDDIIIIFTPNSKNVSTDGYFKSVAELVEKAKLTLKPKDDQKTKEIDLLKHQKQDNEELNYLGYKFTIEAIEVKNGEQKYIEYRPWISISDNKISTYENRIIKTISVYNTESKYDERVARKKLYDRLRFLTGNTKLINSKKGIKAGIYFSNSLLEEKNLRVLALLQGKLQKAVNQSLNPYDKLQVDKDKLKRRILESFSFYNGFKEKRFHTFSANELREIKKAWSDDAM